jgi:hypothetical protein
MMDVKEDPYKFLNRICDNIKEIEDEEEEEEEEEEPVGFFGSEEWEHIVYDDPNRTPQY